MRDATVCEHGYHIDVIDGVVRHVATHGVCLPNDEVYRALGNTCYRGIKWDWPIGPTPAR